jgi:hypothetical protein
MKFLFGRDKSSNGGSAGAENNNAKDTRASINLDLSGWNTSNVTDMYNFKKS